MKRPTKTSNPKARHGIAKPSAGFTPPLAKVWLNIAMQEGAGKYGRFNWRETPVDISTYYSAANRHWDAFYSGQETDPKTGVHHLAYAMACCAIILDAQAWGNLIDDRPRSNVPELLEKFMKDVQHE